MALQILDVQGSCVPTVHDVWCRVSVTQKWMVAPTYTNAPTTLKKGFQKSTTSLEKTIPEEL